MNALKEYRGTFEKDGRQMSFTLLDTSYKGAAKKMGVTFSHARSYYYSQRYKGEHYDGIKVFEVGRKTTAL